MGSHYVFRCGNCGADSELEGAGVVVVVCRFCNWSSLRSDTGVETIGRVAQVTPLASHFQIGTEGSYRGKPFIVRGQIQLDHGAGPWNEWAAETGAGEWLWIAEAQGQIMVLEEAEFAGEREPQSLQVLDDLQLDDNGPFQVTELGRGQILTNAGELPIVAQPGSFSTYADLQRGRDEVATLDWTRGEIPEVFLGHLVELSQLALVPSSQPESTPDRIEARRLDCANCGAGLTIQDPEHALRLGCEACGTLLDIEGDRTQVIAKQKAALSKLAFPLGASAELSGERVTILGCMERAVKSDGRWYPWREYLCRTHLGAYRWLVESNGHWMLTRPLQHSAVRHSSSRLRFDGTNFKHFTSGEAQVRWVVGEFYWRVDAGDRAETHDYISPSAMVSLEHSPNEASASIGSYVEADVLGRAFGVDALASPHGVAAIQPNPANPKGTWMLAGLAVLGLLVMSALMAVGRAGGIVHRETFGPIPSPEGTELVKFSEAFNLEGDLGNVEVSLHAKQVSQGWVGLNGALVHLDSGAVTTFANVAQYYSGRSGGESWSEGSRHDKSLLGSIPKGPYRLRLSLTGYGNGVGQHVEVTVRRSVTNVAFFFMALAALLLPAIVTQIRSIRFEARRWSESDHPWGES